MIFILHGVKYLERSQKIVEIFNEVIFLLIGYTFIVISMSGDLEPEMRFKVGLTLSSLLGILVLFNMVVIIRANVVTLRKSRRMKNLVRKRARVLNERTLAYSTLEAAITLNWMFNYDKPDRLKAIDDQIKGETHQVDLLAKNKLTAMIVLDDEKEQKTREQLAVELMPFRNFGAVDHLEEEDKEEEKGGNDSDHQSYENCESFASHVDKN